ADQSTYLGLKLQPTDTQAAAKGKWEVEVRADLRLPYLVSAIKAAHLSLFKLLGYRYALSAAGYFIGRMVLGEFFLQEHKTPKNKIEEPARKFFESLAHTVKPLISTELDLKGTVTDGRLLVLKGSSGAPWAFVVIVASGEQRHSVLIPTLETADQVDTFF